MKKIMHCRTYWSASTILLLFPLRVFADPLDYGNYVNQSPANFLMDKSDFAWLLLDYGLFASSLIIFGWLFYAKPTYWQRVENLIRYPFARINSMAQAHGGFDRAIGLVLYGINTVLIFLALAFWVFFCQWIKHVGFGGISMAGLALAAIFLVRILSGKKIHS